MRLSAECEEQKAFVSTHLPGRMGSDRFKFCIAPLACWESCVQPCVVGIHLNPDVCSLTSSVL